jgi:hypothetical protein
MKILRHFCSIRSEIVYHDSISLHFHGSSGHSTAESRPLLHLIRLLPSDPQIAHLKDSLKTLQSAEADTRLLIHTNALTRGLFITQPAEGWGYVVEADDNAEMLIGLHDQFLNDLIGFLSTYLKAGEIWPPYADYQLINPRAGDGGPSTVFEIRVPKSGAPRVGDISKMFE